MERDTFYGDFMVKVMLRSGNLIHSVFPINSLGQITECPYIMEKTDFSVLAGLNWSLKNALIT